MDLVPTAQTARLSTRFTMVNRTGRALDSVLVNVASDAPGLAVTLDSLVIDRGATLLAADTAFGVRLLRLAQPLAPGDTVRLHVVQRLAARGFPNGAPDRSLVANGTFLNREWFPTLGYSQGVNSAATNCERSTACPPRVVRSRAPTWPGCSVRASAPTPTSWRSTPR